MSEGIIEEVSDEPQVDEVQQDAVETPEVSEQDPGSESPSLDLDGVFDESPRQDDFRQTVQGLGLEVGEDSRPREVLLDAYEQAANYNHQWQEYHSQQQAREQAYQQQLQQQQQMAEYGRQQYAQEQQRQQEWQQFQMQQYQQQQGVEQEVDPGQWWTPPEINEDELSQWRVRTGRGWTWKAGTPAEIRSKANDYVKYHQEWEDKLKNRPHEVLPEIIEKEFDKLFVDRYGSLLNEYETRQQENHTQQQVQSINDRNADWVYQHDPAGNMVRDVSGQPVLTPQGQRVIQYVNQLRGNGLTDPVQLWDTASRLLAGELAQGSLQSQQQQVQYAQQTQQRNMRHLQQGAGSIRNREGSVAPPENPSSNSQNQSLSAGDKLRQQALADGLF